ncbi:MAG: hypothetical protein OEX07_03675 [Gammaproteobacteria bacterium]|nr:hypothetical protein [Gammaproteobacteria bacterium]
MDLLQEPRYKDTPVYLFFEKYILNVIGCLPEDKQDILQNINLQEIFNSQSSNWRNVVREVLHLSSTIDLAIMYQWHLYLDNAQSHGLELDPIAFSQLFVDEYFSDNSSIDVWTEETLMDAKQFVQENQLLQKA